MGPQLENGFFGERSSIDKGDMITVPPYDEDDFNAWLISSPSTMIVSKRDLSKSLPQYTTYHDSVSIKRTRPIGVSSQTLASQDQRQTPISSDSSAPIMIEDLFGGSDSDIFYEDLHDYHASGAALWDSWQEEDSKSRSFHTDGSNESSQLRYSNFSSCPSQSGYSPRLSSTGDLHRSSAVRAPHGAARHRITPTKHHTYSPFPPPSRLPPRDTRETWPPRKDSKGNRRRANTTPSQPVYRPPSNFSMCSTLETRSQRASSSASTAVYMPTTPSSPQFFQDATISPSMEKSGWYDDEDEESKWWKLRLRTRGNSSIDGGGPPRKKKKLSLGKTFLNNAKEALMEVFRSEE
jgi:hypothetical protein